jgi:flagellar basal body-associated protein FliL
VAEAERETTDSERAARKGGTKKLILTFVPLVLIALVAAKITVLERPATPAAVAARAAVRQRELAAKCAHANGLTAPPAPAVTGPTLDLDSKTMNLDGNHYLKVGVSLQLPAKAVVDDVKVTENWASVAGQLVLDTFTSRSFAELSKDGVRLKLQHEIGYRTCERTGGKVVTVYFVDFVMQ